MTVERHPEVHLHNGDTGEIFEFQAGPFGEDGGDGEESPLELVLRAVPHLVEWAAEARQHGKRLVISVATRRES